MWKMYIPSDYDGELTSNSNMDPVLSSPCDRDMDVGAEISSNIDDQLLPSDLFRSPFLPSPPDTKQPEIVWGAEEKLMAPARTTWLEEIALEDICNICQEDYNHPPPAEQGLRRRSVIIQQREEIVTDYAGKQRTNFGIIPQSDIARKSIGTKVEDSFRFESLPTWGREEDVEAGSFLLANFPFLVVSLMLVMVAVLMVMRLITDISDCTVPLSKTSWILYGGQDFREHNLTSYY